MKLYPIVAALSLFATIDAHAQAKPEGLVLEVYGKQAVFKKKEFLACEKTFDDDMKNKCKEGGDKLNMDASVAEEGGCFDQVAQARDECQGKAFVGNVGDKAVAGYKTEPFEKKEPAKKDAKKSKDEDAVLD